MDEITQIVERSPKTGAIYIGGGILKNYSEWHSYAIQYTHALYGAGFLAVTFEDAVSS